MADDLITIQLRLTGGTAAAAEAKKVAGSIDGLGNTTSSSMAKSSASTSKFKSTLSSLGRTMAYGSIPLIGALGYELTKSVNAYRESRKVGEQTAAVIKSTGNAAKVTAQEVARLSSNLSLKTGVDDEEIQAGANMLLTFKNVRNEVGKGNDIFNQATEIMNDMSSALGQDMKSSAIQLGKALNDPVAGITALSRVGVTFDEKTKEQIATLVKQGKTLKAQKIILKELTSEFKGSAKAQHDSVDRLGVAWENLEEVLGKALYPILQKVTQWLTKALRQASHGKGPLIDLKNTFIDVGNAIGDSINFIKDYIHYLDVLVTPLREIVQLVKTFHDLTEKDFLAAPDAVAPAVDFADNLDTSPGGGKGGKGGSGKVALPDVVSPKTRRQSGKRGDLYVTVVSKLDGKTVAKNTTKHALAAAARA